VIFCGFSRRPAKETNFEVIEVFSNLTRLSEDTLEFSSANNIFFATSCL